MEKFWPELQELILTRQKDPLEDHIFLASYDLKLLVIQNTFSVTLILHVRSNLDYPDSSRPQ